MQFLSKRIWVNMNLWPIGLCKNVNAEKVGKTASSSIILGEKDLVEMPLTKEKPLVEGPVNNSSCKLQASSLTMNERII